MNPPQSEHFRRRAQFGRIVPVERRDAQALLPQVGEVAGDEGDEERGARNRAIDPRELGRMRAQLLGDGGGWRI
jgi:hypothetical protein